MDLAIVTDSTGSMGAFLEGERGNCSYFWQRSYSTAPSLVSHYRDAPPLRPHVWLSAVNGFGAGTTLTP